MRRAGLLGIVLLLAGCESDEKEMDRKLAEFRGCQAVEDSLKAEARALVADNVPENSPRYQAYSARFDSNAARCLVVIRELEALTDRR
jgi:hypothetical protein